MYGIYNTLKKEFQFGICEPTKRKAIKKLFKKIGKDAYKWRFEVKKIIEPKEEIDMTDQGRELGWDDQIENDGPEFVVLPEGDYDFEVIEFERGRHPGSDKLPPCNKATVHIKIQGPEGVSIIKHNLYLHSITEGMLCAFFTGIGQRKKGERVTMNWNAVVGAKGRAKVGTRVYEGKTYNEIKKFYEPGEGAGKTFEAGKF